MDISEFGMAISTPVLITESGRLKVRIQFILSLYSRDKLIEDIYNQVEFQDDTIFQKNNLDIKNINRFSSIKSIFDKVFKLKFTSNKGWSDIDFFYTNFNVKERILDLTFDLEKNEPRPEVYNQKIHGENFDTNWPVIKIVLNNVASLPPYRLLQILEAEEVAIEVQVSCVEQMQISNQLGELDIENPFQPFGPIPELGSKLKISNPYFLSKYLSKLTLNFQWSGLPLIRNGFTEYYNSYPYDYNNESFCVGLSVRRGKTPVKHRKSYQEFRLFRTEIRDDWKYLLPNNSEEVDLDSFEVDKGPGLTAEERTSNDLAIFLALNSPAKAFGHQVYSELFGSICIQNSRLRKKKLELPKQPYTPVLDHFSVDYTNYTKENMVDKNPKKNINIKIFPLDSSLK
jgi:hypothetical protein